MSIVDLRRAVIRIDATEIESLRAEVARLTGELAARTEERDAALTLAEPLDRLYEWAKRMVRADLHSPLEIMGEYESLREERDGLTKQRSDLLQCWKDEENAHGKTIDQRDEAEGAFQDLVASLGVNSEFSSARNFEDMANDCAGAFNSLKLERDELAAGIVKLHGMMVEITRDEVECALSDDDFAVRGWVNRIRDKYEAVDALLENPAAILAGRDARAKSEGLREAAKRAREIANSGVGRYAGLTADELDRMAAQAEKENHA